MDHHTESREVVAQWYTHCEVFREARLFIERLSGDLHTAFLFLWWRSNKQAECQRMNRHGSGTPPSTGRQHQSLQLVWGRIVVAEGNEVEDEVGVGEAPARISHAGQV